MGRKVVQDFANALPEMFVARLRQPDFEALAELPDGKLSIDILNAAAGHSSGATLRLSIVAELNVWLQERLAAHDMRPEDLTDARLVVAIQTDAPSTDKRRIVSFEFGCESVVRTADRTYEGRLVARHRWHTRTGGGPEAERGAGDR